MSQYQQPTGPLVAAAGAAGLSTMQLHLLYCTVGALLWAALPGALASAAAMLQAGDAAYGNGDYSTAIRHYTTALDIDATAPLFYTKRAAAYMSLKKYAQALKDLDRAVDVDDTFMQGYLHRGKLHRYAASSCSSKPAVSLHHAVLCCIQLTWLVAVFAEPAVRVESYGRLAGNAILIPMHVVTGDDME
jgi:tetratricopeptide (TPR) repeat protein